MSGQPLEDLLARLERERLAADRAYNDALTALDGALHDAPGLPAAPRAYDAGRVTPINESWRILGGDAAPPPDRSAKGRLRAFIWRLVGPPLEAQQRFNAEIVDHINRNVTAHQDAQRTIDRLLAVARGELDARARFESMLVQYLQTITAYVDTKVRRAGGDEIQDRLLLVEQRLLALKRELDRSAPARPMPVAPADAAPQSPLGAVPAPQAFSANVDSLTYVGFEDRFRGSQDDIRSRVDDYLPILTAAADVLDVGCGRGELLDLLRASGVRARGVDTNDAMVQLCRARGLDVEQGDALGFLERRADGSLGGLVAVQVVEHFDPPYLLRFLETAFHKLRPGSPLILETINPSCWMAYFECYIRDITHKQPLHPDTLRYLVTTSGFTHVAIQYRQPVREADRLDRVDAGPPGTTASPWTEVVAALNAHADKLNDRLFSSMDYAVVARR